MTERPDEGSAYVGFPAAIDAPWRDIISAKRGYFGESRFVNGTDS